MAIPLELTIDQGDITQFPADLIGLKYAQAFYGADKAVAAILAKRGIEDARLRPADGDCRVIETAGAVVAPRAIFVGIRPLHELGYRDLRVLAVKTIQLVGREAPDTRHLALTLHGPGFGLDEAESALAQLGGILEVVEEDQVPSALEHVSLVEIRPDRVKRVQAAFKRTLAKMDTAKPAPDGQGFRLGTVSGAGPTRSARRSIELDSAGTASAAKASVFVAMPFAQSMDDVFYYGIQQPAHATGYLCERVDQEAFTGDILARVKERIDCAAVVIAELSGANPNVYLEVGYAWGKNRPTILVAKSDQELKFDVRGQRCLIYQRIRDLEEALSKELAALKGKGRV